MDRALLLASIEASTSFEFARSGGPGGQNVNKVNSKAVARIRLEELAGLSEAELARARIMLANRITKEGELVLAAEAERDQGRNRAIALERLFNLISAAAALPRKRRPTKPTAASRERRLASKRVRAETKRGRRPSPEAD